MSKKKSNFKTVRLTDELLKRLEQRAKKEDRPVSSMIRVAVKYYLDHVRKD